LKLFLFTTDVDYATEALACGVDGLVIDWEYMGKESRQASADTEINHDTPADLRRMSAVVGAPILVRINSVGDHTAAEVEEAVDGGATEVLVPMVRRIDDVRRVLDLVDERCGVGILIETTDAVRIVAQLSELPLTRVYVGLNDLAIDRGSLNIFSAVADGTVAAIRDHCSLPFGFGGLTHPRRGAPIPCDLFLSEMVRLGASFSFLRRSFRRDAAELGIAAVTSALREEISHAISRTHGEMVRYQRDFVSLVGAEASV
jgi:2-keto-3-deoxy-L-rhamnonate aldolase RhmA